MYGAWATATEWQAGFAIGSALEQGAPEWCWRSGGTWQPSLSPRGAYHDPNPPLPLEEVAYLLLAGVAQGEAVTGPVALVLNPLILMGVAQGEGSTSDTVFGRDPLVLITGGAVGEAQTAAVMLRNTPRMAVVRAGDVPVPSKAIARAYDAGQVVELTAVITDRDGQPLDPPIVRCRVKDPSGQEATYVYGLDSPLRRDGPGLYRLPVQVRPYGYWFYRWEALSDEQFGPGVGGAAEAVFEVRRSQFLT